MWLLAVIASAKDGVTGDVVCTARNACWPYHADAWRHADNPCDKEAVFDGRGGRIRVFYDDEVQPVTGIVDQVFGSVRLGKKNAGNSALFRARYRLYQSRVQQFRVHFQKYCQVLQYMINKEGGS